MTDYDALCARLTKTEPDLPGDRTRWCRNPDGHEAADAIAALVAEKARLGRCLNFFASVIKSGEPWTATCQREYDAALAPAPAPEGEP